MQRLQRLRVFLPPLIILLVGAGVFAALVLTRPEPPAHVEEEPSWVVTTHTVQLAARTPTLSLYGRLESPRDATLAAAVEADVTAVPAAEGLTVTAGERLVSLERSDLETALAQRRAELAEIEAQIREARVQHEADEAALARQRDMVAIAERGVARAEKLAGRDAGSQAELDAAREALAQRRLSLIQQGLQVDSFPARLERLQAQRDQAEARLARARRDLARTIIDAPFGGRITEVAVAPGDRVRSGDPLVSLYDPTHLEVRATVPSPHVMTVRQALEAGEPPTATVTVDGRRLQAVLDRLGGRSPQGGGGVEALFRVTGKVPEDLPLGRFTEVTVALPPEPDVAAVPFAALYGRDRVYVVRDGRMKAIRVDRVGQHAEGAGPNRALVRASELRTGDEVVTTQLPQAMDGLEVRIADGEAERRP